MKLFGDALRNSVTRMSNDPVKMISFFKNVEQLNESMEVPTELKAALIRPRLNERAKSLVTGLSADMWQKTMTRCAMPFWQSLNCHQICTWIGLITLLVYRRNNSHVCF